MKKVLLYIALIAVGAFLWWAFSPLLLDKEVQDELDPVLKARLEAQRQVDERNKSGGETSNINENSEISVETSITNEESGVFTTGPFPIQDTPSHPASGELEIVYSPEETLLYYKNYQGTNGPDLHVYLAKDLEANEYLDLGPAKGNSGDIIYGLPMDVDLDEYKYVLTWCRAFDTLFDYVELK